MLTLKSHGNFLLIYAYILVKVEKQSVYSFPEIRNKQGKIIIDKKNKMQEIKVLNKYHNNTIIINKI